MSFGSLSPIDQSLMPADIRNGTPARKNAYEAAASFEQQLVQQLTQSISDTTQDASGGDDSPYASMLPDALAQGIMNGGGLGLARQLTDAMVPPSPADAGTTTPTSTSLSTTTPTTGTA